jgi:DNA-directed RNA polymerase specialized sigma54-like protein
LKKSLLTPQQREMLKKAYYHPFEKYEEKETALKLNKSIKKEIKNFIDSHASANPLYDRRLSVIIETAEDGKSFSNKKSTLTGRKRLTLR